MASHGHDPYRGLPLRFGGRQSSEAQVSSGGVGRRLTLLNARRHTVPVATWPDAWSWVERDQSGRSGREE